MQPTPEYEEHLQKCATRNGKKEQPRLHDNVVEPRDGDTHRRVVRTRAGFLATLLLFLTTHTEYYRFHAHLGAQQVPIILSTAAKKMFPARLLGGWRGKWKESQIPYFYAFMKSGCFPHGLLCCDRDHSHLREIVSSCTYPTPIKRVVQWVAKAF